MKGHGLGSAVPRLEPLLKAFQSNTVAAAVSSCPCCCWVVLPHVLNIACLEFTVDRSTSDACGRLITIFVESRL